MIIILKNTDLNNKAAKYLTEHYRLNDDNKYYYPFDPGNEFKSAAGEPCFIVDLDEYNVFQSLLSPEAFADELLLANLPSSITDIYLIASENIFRHPLGLFAHRLSQFISEKSNKKILVHTVTELNHEMTQLIFLPEECSWQIYGINDWKNPDQKVLLWKGKDILQWLNHPQRTFTGVTYAWP